MPAGHCRAQVCEPPESPLAPLGAFDFVDICTTMAADFMRTPWFRMCSSLASCRSSAVTLQEKSGASHMRTVEDTTGQVWGQSHAYSGGHYRTRLGPVICVQWRTLQDKTGASHMRTVGDSTGQVWGQSHAYGGGHYRTSLGPVTHVQWGTLHVKSGAEQSHTAKTHLDFRLRVLLGILQQVMNQLLQSENNFEYIS